MKLLETLFGFEHMYCRHLYIFMCIRLRTGPRQRSAYSLKVLLYID